MTYLKVADDTVQITAIPYPTAFCSKLQVLTSLLPRKHTHTPPPPPASPELPIVQVATVCWAAPPDDEDAGLDNVTFIGSAHLLAVPTGSAIQATPRPLQQSRGSSAFNQ